MFTYSLEISTSFPTNDMKNLIPQLTCSCWSEPHACVVERLLLNSNLRCWKHFLIRPLYLVGVWFDEDQRTNTIRHMFQKDWIVSVNSLPLLHTQLGGSMGSIKVSTNMHFQ